MKKELPALLLAIAVLVGALCYFTSILTPKRLDYGATWDSFLCEEKDSIDVMFFGSSIVYCDVVPAVYWDTSGLTAYVNAGPEQTLPITAEYIRQSLKTQSPKAIFVECSGLCFHQYEDFTKVNIGQMPWGIPRLRATFSDAEPELIGGLLFPMIFYHDRWSTLTREDFAPDSPDPFAGYTRVDHNDKADMTCETFTVAPGDWARNFAALEEIAALCQEKGISLVLYRAPIELISNEDWNKVQTRFDGMAGIWCLNCVEKQDEIGADFPADWFDGQHYNYAGAEKFSVFLADWTKQTLSISPRTDVDPALWSQRLTYFEQYK